MKKHLAQVDVAMVLVIALILGLSGMASAIIYGNSRAIAAIIKSKAHSETMQVVHFGGGFLWRRSEMEKIILEILDAQKDFDKAVVEAEKRFEAARRRLIGIDARKSEYDSTAAPNLSREID
jgi:hypothetical protein